MGESGGGERVVLGLGANVGRPVEQLAEALRRLRAVVEVDAVSSVWRTAPVGYAGQPDFFNLVCAGTTRLAPGTLLDATQALERGMGRAPSFRNAPRPLDVDLLDHGGRVLRTPRLTLPHPGIPSRAFVLRPLAEAVPGWRHPLLRLTARELLHRAGALERADRWGPPPVSP